MKVEKPSSPEVRTETDRLDKELKLSGLSDVRIAKMKLSEKREFLRRRR